MKARELMTQHPAFCRPDAKLDEVARMMVQHDCGEIPVVESRESMRPIGVVTDRDIVCRSIAQGRNPIEMTARDCMTAHPVIVTPETSLQDCSKLMQQHQLRRILVVTDQGQLCGIVAQADIAAQAPSSETAKMVKQVSQPQTRAA